MSDDVDTAVVRHDRRWLSIWSCADEKRGEISALIRSPGRIEHANCLFEELGQESRYDRALLPIIPRHMSAAIRHQRMRCPYPPHNPFRIPNNNAGAWGWQ